MKRSLLSVVVLVSALLPLLSGEWRDAARKQRERADRLRERGLQICRQHAFLDEGFFNRKGILTDDLHIKGFRNGRMISSAYSGGSFTSKLS